MSWLVQIVVAIIRALLPALFQSTKPTCEEARGEPELRRRLRDAIRRDWGPSAMALVLVLSLLTVTGCWQPRTIYVPHGRAVRLRRTIPNAKVWVRDADGKPAPGRMDLPEGWYCLPNPGVGGAES